ncbi:MAG: hypothetical protein GX843_00530 [Synergistaceae bacterium]|nr:hypothetical protein [Synergistaceae bacterium]
MRKYGVICGLVLLFALLAAGGSAALAEDVPVLEMSPEVMEKLKPLGPVFNLDWGLYRNT